MSEEDSLFSSLFLGGKSLKELNFPEDWEYDPLMFRWKSEKEYITFQKATSFRETGKYFSEPKKKYLYITDLMLFNAKKKNPMTPTRQNRPFIALRPNQTGQLDDVVVEQVEMFRAEQMDTNLWWLCCYLKNGERITWYMKHTNKGLVMKLVESPEKVEYEQGSLSPENCQHKPVRLGRANYRCKKCGKDLTPRVLLDA